MLTPATAKELPVEQAIFNEAWSMIKEYHNIEAWGNDAEWKQVVDRADKLYEKGKGKPELEQLSKDMSMAVICYLEKISKDKGDKEACIAQRMKELEQEEALKKKIKSI